MGTQHLIAADAALKVVRGVWAPQQEPVSPVEEDFTSTHSTPAALIPAVQDTSLMRVS